MGRVELTDVIIRKLRQWVQFVGPARVAAGAVSLVLVGCLGVWMFVPTAPAAELSVPRVSVPATGDAAPLLVPQVPREVRVHVAGAVRHPGVYVLSTDDRVVDAVEAAGGAAPGADLDSINLAQTLKDTEQIYVPRRTVASRSRRPAPRLQPRRPATITVPPAATGSTASAAGPVSINTATAAQLDTLPGIGPATAKAIVAYRSSKGPFARVEDLLNVPGIGPAKLDAMRRQISL